MNSNVIDSLTLLCRRGQELSSISDLDSLLARVLETAQEICSARGASILMLDESADELFFLAVTGDRAEQVQKVKFDKNKGIAGWVLEHRKAVIVNDVSSDPRHFSIVDANAQYETKKLMCVPIMWENNVVGVMNALNKKDDEDFTHQDLEYLTVLANQAGASLHITSMMGKLQNFYANMLEILMMATETLGSQQGHSVRVARLATKIAREMNVSEKTYKDIYYASLIHDIGQIRVAKDRIVGGERLIPILGAEMIKPIKLLNPITKIVESCRERWNGSGYPKALKGEEIPLASRIIALAEDYVDWIEEESYKKQFDPYLQDDFFRRINTVHDPNVIKAFKSVRKKERLSHSDLQKV